jgi:hypothetical protein
MAKSIKPEDLGAAIEQELTLYHQNVIERVNVLSKEAVSKLVKLTRATAPKGERGSFRKSISSKQIGKGQRGNVYVWYVKAPDHRLTHLLVHGHATRNGGRTKSNPFLKNAVDEVLPEYEKNVEEALKNG